jgi:hypothetical protein
MTMKADYQKYTRDEIVVEAITWTVLAALVFFAG